MDFGSVGNMLSAVPGGYQQGMQANNQIEQQQMQLADQRAKQVGTAAYFRALQAMLGPQTGQGPQPPSPGQPSMAANAMPGPQMVPPSGNVAPPQGMVGGAPSSGMVPQQQPTGAAAPGSPAGATSPPGGPAPAGPSGGQQQLSWQGIVQALKTQNPNASDLELAHAVDHFMPMMTMQNKLEWQQMRNELMWEMTKMRTDTQARGQDIRADTSTRGQDVRAGSQADRTQQQREQEEGRQGRFDTSEDRRNRSLDQRDAQFKQREDRLERGLQLRSDTTWTRLDQQKQAAEQRVRAGDRRQAVIEWRATVDAQHKLAMEKIQATSVNNAMKPADRQKLIEDQNAWYRGEIEKMKNLTTQRGNLTDQGEPTGQTTEDLPRTNAPPAAPAAPAGAPVPPKPNEVRDGYRFKGGNPADPQSWEKVSMSDEQLDPVQPGQQYAAMAPRPPLGEAGVRGGGGGVSPRAPAANESKGFEGLPKDYVDIQNTLAQWARGKMSARDVKAALEKRGWSMDRYELQRNKLSDVEVFAPDGTAHYISP